MLSHEVTTGEETWFTPREILDPLGPFDLDPCTSELRPFSTAREHWTRPDNGLGRPWYGRVWCNPPYGNKLAAWLERCARHGNAIALVFARTETGAFRDFVWPYASGLLFLDGRIRFIASDGSQASTGIAPSVLISYGSENAEALRRSSIAGAFVVPVSRCS